MECLSPNETSWPLSLLPSTILLSFWVFELQPKYPVRLRADSRNSLFNISKLLPFAEGCFQRLLNQMVRYSHGHGSTSLILKLVIPFIIARTQNLIPTTWRKRDLFWITVSEVSFMYPQQSQIQKWYTERDCYGGKPLMLWWPGSSA